MTSLNKIAAMEPSGIIDPASGLPISVSTTTRLMFRKINPQYEKTRNNELNKVIAESFAASSSRVVHRFYLKPSKDIAEIRNMQGPSAWTVMFFISVVRAGFIQILTLQNGWLKQKYKAEQKPLQEPGQEPE